MIDKKTYHRIYSTAYQAGRREGAERVLSSLSYPNRSALRENVRENLEQQYANIFGKRCTTDAARRLAECALETTVDFLVRALPLTPEEPTSKYRWCNRSDCCLCEMEERLPDECRHYVPEEPA